MNKLKEFLRSNILIKGSILLFFGSILSNFGSYVFHLSMGRLLGPVDYGILESLISLVYYLSIPMSVLTLVIVKFVSEEKKNSGRTVLLLKKVYKLLLTYGLFFYLLFVLLYPILGKMLKIPSFFPWVLIVSFSYFGMYSSVLSAIFQGLTNFFVLTLLGVVSSWSKAIFSFLLVILGFKLLGSVLGMLFSTIVVFVMGIVLIKKHLKNFIVKTGNEIVPNLFKNMGKNYLFIFLANTSITSMYTTDIILAKYYLPATEAGYYAALSILGKIIFFAASPVVSVMFPVISFKKANGEKCSSLLYQSAAFLGIVCLGIGLAYFFFPKLMISFLFGKEYFAGSQYLFSFGIFISIYSFCYLLLNYFLSISEYKATIAPIFFSFFQIGAIALLRGKSIGGIVNANIVSVSLLLVVLLILFLVNEKRNAHCYNSGI